MFKDEYYLLVADPGFHAIRSIKPEKKGINNLEVTNVDKESFYAFALCSLKEEKILVTDPVKCCIYVLHIEEGCLCAFIDQSLMMSQHSSKVTGI